MTILQNRKIGLTKARNWINMASKTDFKGPPSLHKDITYSTWKRELAIWQAFTSIENKKQAPAIFLTLTGQAREAALEIDIKKLNADDGVKNLIEALDKLYLQDEACSAYEAYEIFEKFVRPAEMSIADYIIQFERFHIKAKSHSMEIHDGVLAYRLLNGANLDESHKQLIRATLSEMKYDTMKEQLKKVFTNAGNAHKQNGEPAIKIESSASFYSKSLCSEMMDSKMSNSEQDGHYAYYEDSYVRSPRGRGRFQGNRVGGYGMSVRDNDGYSGRDVYRGGFRGNNFRGARAKVGTRQNNPLDANGQISRCSVCGSKFHWARQCPDSYETKAKTAEYQTL